MKKNIFSVIKSLAFIFSMTAYGLSTESEFNNNSRVFAFLFLSIAIIIAWNEIKNVALSFAKGKH